MDLRMYYQKIRQIEEGMREANVVIESLETSDGGRAGVRTEAPRRIAACLIVEGKARLLTEEETSQFRAEMAEAHRAAEQAAAAAKVQLAVVTEGELRQWKNGPRGGKQ